MLECRASQWLGFTLLTSIFAINPPEPPGVNSQTPVVAAGLAYNCQPGRTASTSGRITGPWSVDGIELYGWSEKGGHLAISRPRRGGSHGCNRAGGKSVY